MAEKTYIKVNLQKDSEYPGVSIWKNEYDQPANLMFSSMEFELDTTDLKPGKYKLQVWKNANKKSEKSPSGSISLNRIEGGDASESSGSSESDGKSTDFNF